MCLNFHFLNKGYEFTVREEERNFDYEPQSYASNFSYRPPDLD